jgi:hypothetical protein
MWNQTLVACLEELCQHCLECLDKSYSHQNKTASAGIQNKRWSHCAVTFHSYSLCEWWQCYIAYRNVIGKTSGSHGEEYEDDSLLVNLNLNAKKSNKFLQITVVRDAAPCNLVEIDRRFRGTFLNS